MLRKNLRWMAAILMATNMAVLTPSNLLAAPKEKGDPDPAAAYETTTPIKHVVVIFQENVTFDHYFATYPNATNPEGEVKFKAKEKTPTVNGITESQAALDQNTVKPFRLDPSQNYTCSMNHGYQAEQQAFDSGLMDMFPEFTAHACTSQYPSVQPLGTGIVMGYFDGNTVTAEWNYAQNYAMSDNMHDTNFGPSTVGAINVISGMTGNTDPTTSKNNGTSDVIAGSIVGDPDPAFDDCAGTDVAGMQTTNENIGMLLGARKISWGWFEGGFTPSTAATATAKAVCATTTNRLDGTAETAYVPHHNPFEYYQQTANPHHLPPASLAEVGHDGQANHQYDLSWFTKAAMNGDLPAVSYLKAPAAEDGHPGNSSPLDEQVFLTQTINMLESLPTWSSTAVIITYDDSDGWFDHVMGPILNQSVSADDALSRTGACGIAGNSLEGLQGRCAYGPRLPFIVISPYSKTNYVDSTVIDQSSVVRFIEDNWTLPRIGNGSFDEFAGSIENMFNFKNPPGENLILDPYTGAVLSSSN
jgi:phospholipase C